MAPNQPNLCQHSGNKGVQRIRSNFKRACHWHLYRWINFLAGILLFWIMTLQSDSSNVCVWRVCFGFNAVVAVLIALEPRVTENVAWTCFSVTSSTVSLFLLLVMAIQLIRTVTDRHSTAVMYEDSLGIRSNRWFHPTWNILRYEEGKESIGIGILLLWIKYANAFRIYR